MSGWRILRSLMRSDRDSLDKSGAGSSSVTIRLPVRDVWHEGTRSLARYLLQGHQSTYQGSPQAEVELGVSSAVFLLPVLLTSRPFHLKHHPHHSTLYAMNPILPLPNPLHYWLLLHPKASDHRPDRPIQLHRQPHHYPTPLPPTARPTAEFLRQRHLINHPLSELPIWIRPA